MPDLIHIHGVSTQADAALHMHRHHGVPLVISTHGEITGDAHGLYRRAHARRSFRALIAEAAAVTAPSVRVASDAADAGLALPDDVRVIGNGIDLDFWRATPSVPDAATVGAWGHDSPEKGWDRLLLAWPLVLQDVPQATLWIGGDAGRALDEKGVGACDRGVTLLTDASTPTQIREQLGLTRVVVVPSRVEAFGLVALEGLAARRGVVYSTGTGMDETVGDHGLAANADDPSALASAIVKALQRPVTVASDSAFTSWSDVADAYLALYREALAG